MFSLRELLAAEDAQYLDEAASSKDNLAQRIAKMRQKAKRIREEKESDHAKLVQEKYDQRFRRDCAELRELQSKELDHELGNEHLWQMQEKYDRKTDKKVRLFIIHPIFHCFMQSEEEFWTQLWYQDIAKKQEREDQDAYNAKVKTDAMTKVIREQMQAVEAERAAQKSKRKDYSDAAVDRRFDLIIRDRVVLFSGLNSVQKKKKKSRNIRINYVNKMIKDAF